MKIIGVKNLSNNIRQMANSFDDMISTRVAKRSYKAADKYVKFDFDDFSKGSAPEKLYEARTMFGKIAKDNKVTFTFSKSLPGSIKVVIAKLNDKSLPNKKTAFFSDDVNGIFEHERLIARVLHTNKDGLEVGRECKIFCENNFLRNAYITLEHALSNLKK